MTHTIMAIWYDQPDTVYCIAADQYHRPLAPLNLGRGEVRCGFDANQHAVLSGVDERGNVTGRHYR